METTCNITNAFGPGTDNECTVQCCCKKFCKGDEGLKDGKCRGGPSEVDKDLLRAITEAYSLRSTQEVAKELIIDHSMIIQHLKQTGKVKNQKVGASLADQKSKIVVVLKSCLHLLYATT